MLLCIKMVISHKSLVCCHRLIRVRNFLVDATTELKNMEKRYINDWLIMVISQQYGNVLSVLLLPSNDSHFLAALRYALTNVQFTAF